ncbi:type III pantothenate kinase [Leeuwenhoekiella aestuarii]|uniref:Type III pantothenate kinase n=1 Tax=Leeuwenhoekiella aestuarii TaxID=2249426 RepID=A0A4Q0NQN9_9FLAO|nr:type III pantothenate kinase [Leeuwenhoekiella aestuarii]RXG12728.1 type III pantothenate kinase [Leeuwenhoekiella aestuarii]RXG14675.1 type III pantothenate kinase [Leeuwenhoekiella aestuarii]
MVNLAVDLGNTRVKYGVFEDSILKMFWAGGLEEATAKLLELERAFEIAVVAICATGNSKDFVTFVKNRGLSVEVLSAQTVLPFQNDYETPQTLGVDRIALVAGAQKKYPGSNVLVIDAGTCVTYDFKDFKNVYRGGAISPGLQMRFKAMHEFTAGLPYIEVDDEAIDVIGVNTKTALQSGAVNGLVAEIDGLIDWYKKNYSELTIILTGGDGQFLSSRLKNGIFANSNFLLEGLNYITEFNRN